MENIKNNLTVEEVLFIHYRILIELQPLCNDLLILNEDSLIMALEKITPSEFEKDSMPDVFQKAAILTQSFISDHIFFNSNERVAITLGIVLMLNNGFEITATNKDVFLASKNISKVIGHLKKQNIGFKIISYIIIKKVLSDLGIEDNTREEQIKIILLNESLMTI